MSNTTPIPVMVTGVGGGGLGEQIVKCLRLADTAYHIIGCDILAQSAGLGMVDVPYILPMAREPSYLDALITVCRRHDVRAVFHGSDPELRVLSANRKLLAEEGLFVPMNPPDVLEVCLDKSRTARRLADLGFSVPMTYRVCSMADVEQWDHFPALLKPSTISGGSANVHIVQNREQLRTDAKPMLTIFKEFVIQAYVGTPESEYTVGVLIDMDGEIINSIAVRRTILVALSNKLRIPNQTDRAELGPVLAVSSGISQGWIGRFEQVTSVCEEIACSLGARAAINIQCRLVDGEVVVFEINPRFSGTSSMRAMVGYNEPDVLIRRHLLGEHIEPHFPYRECTIMRGLSEVIVPVEDIPRAEDL